MELFAIGDDLEGAATRGHERKRRNPIAEFENLSRQTDGFRRVVSNAAILDPDFGFHQLLSRAELIGKSMPALERRGDELGERFKAAFVFGVEAVELRAVEIEDA